MGKGWSIIPKAIRALLIIPEFPKRITQPYVLSRLEIQKGSMIKPKDKARFFGGRLAVM
jgi:hypothetical protein